MRWKNRRKRERDPRIRRGENRGSKERMNWKWKGMKREKSCYTCNASWRPKRRLTGHWPANIACMFATARGRWANAKEETDREKERKKKRAKRKEKRREKGNALKRAEGARQRPWQTCNETPGVLRTMQDLRRPIFVWRASSCLSSSPLVAQPKKGDTRI